MIYISNLIDNSNEYHYYIFKCIVNEENVINEALSCGYIYNNEKFFNNDIIYLSIGSNLYLSINHEPIIDQNHKFIVLM